MRHSSLPEPVAEAMWRTLVDEDPDFDPAAFAAGFQRAAPPLSPELRAAMERVLDDASPVYRASRAATVAENRLRTANPTGEQDGVWSGPAQRPLPYLEPEEKEPALTLFGAVRKRVEDREQSTYEEIGPAPPPRYEVPSIGDEVLGLVTCRSCGERGEVVSLDLTGVVVATVVCTSCESSWQVEVGDPIFSEFASLTRVAGSSARRL